MDESEIIAEQVVFSDGRRLDEVVEELMNQMSEIKTAVSGETAAE